MCVGVDAVEYVRLTARDVYNPHPLPPTRQLVWIHQPTAVRQEVLGVFRRRLGGPGDQHHRQCLGGRRQRCVHDPGTESIAGNTQHTVMCLATPWCSRLAFVHTDHRSCEHRTAIAGNLPSRPPPPPLRTHVQGSPSTSVGSVPLGSTAVVPVGGWAQHRSTLYVHVLPTETRFEFVYVLPCTVTVQNLF